MTHTDSIASDLLAWRVYVGKRCKSRKAAIDKRRPGQRRFMHVERTELTKRRVSAGRRLDRGPTQPSDRFLISYPPFATGDFSRPLRLFVAKVPTASILLRLTAPASKRPFSPRSRWRRSNVGFREIGPNERPLCGSSSTDRYWPGAAVPNISRKPPMESWGSAKVGFPTLPRKAAPGKFRSYTELRNDSLHRPVRHQEGSLTGGPQLVDVVRTLNTRHTVANV